LDTREEGLGANVMRATRAWGGNAPDWIVRLAQECDRVRSQLAVAKAMNVSATAVNQALGRSYRGRMDLLEARVRGALMRSVVACPVLGDIPTNECMDHQRRKFRATNPLRVRLYRACKSCPNREGACSNAAK